jgi:hypothetical protein
LKYSGIFGEKTTKIKKKILQGIPGRKKMKYLTKKTERVEYKTSGSGP